MHGCWRDTVDFIKLAKYPDLPAKGSMDIAANFIAHEYSINTADKRKKNITKGEKQMDTIIGIDLGTSTTEAAVYRNVKPVLMLDFDGKEVTPSVVGVG